MLIKIFSEKVEFDSGPKVEATNPGYKRGGGHAQIFNERVEFDAEPRVDHLNLEYKPSGGNKQVLFNKQYFT